MITAASSTQSAPTITTMSRSVCAAPACCPRMAAPPLCPWMRRITLASTFCTAHVYGWQKGVGLTEQIIGRWFAKGDLPDRLGCMTANRDAWPMWSSGEISPSLIPTAWPVLRGLPDRPDGIGAPGIGETPARSGVTDADRGHGLQHSGLTSGPQFKQCVVGSHELGRQAGHPRSSPQAGLYSGLEVQ
jgi:hypothetical protein